MEDIAPMSHVVDTVKDFAKKQFSSPITRAIADPVAYALNSAAPSNDLVKILTPGQTTGRRLAEGDSANPKTALDPGAFFTQSKAQKDAYQAKVDAALAAIPHAPNQDVAANAAQQQSDYMRRRRGVLANIFGGSQPNSAPVATGNKSSLGT